MAHDLDQAGRRKDREAILGIEAAEKISREKWDVEFLYAVGPLAARLVHGQKNLVAFSEEMPRHKVFVSELGVESEPK
jgi:hypothetical protein